MTNAFGRDLLARRKLVYADAAYVIAINRVAEAVRNGVV